MSIISLWYFQFSDNYILFHTFSYISVLKTGQTPTFLCVSLRAFELDCISHDERVVYLALNSIVLSNTQMIRITQRWNQRKNHFWHCDRAPPTVLCSELNKTRFNESRLKSFPPLNLTFIYTGSRIEKRSLVYKRDLFWTDFSLLWSWCVKYTHTSIYTVYMYI